MINREINSRIQRFFALVCAFAITLTFAPLPITVHAEETEHPKIIVSLGDSYSSGEGIPPFYGQNEDLSSKVKNEDWLAHRSQKSWPGMLTLPSVDGTMAENRNYTWFFTAVSGAETVHIKGQQSKTYNKRSGFTKYSDTVELPAQLDIFDKLNGRHADYVTLTLGGNDAGFADIIKNGVVFGSTYLKFSNLSDMLNETWADFYKENGIQDNLRQAYKDISQKAGKQATIIVAGYPTLLAAGGALDVVSKEEATLVNNNVRNFNRAIESLVNSCRASGMDIHFVSVESAFEGHEAYSDDAYINEVILLAQSEDLTGTPGSSYSIHPNEKGARAYAECVQAKLDELEGLKAVQYSTHLNISTMGADGALCSDYTIKITGREYIALWGLISKDYEDEITVNEANPVRLILPEGRYLITVTAGSNVYRQTIRTLDNCENNVLYFFTDFGPDESEDSTSQPDKEPIRTTSDERDIVLVLDTSGSMSGTPMAETKKASVNFIGTILDEDASIGIVTYDDSASMLSDFSVNEAALKTAVSGIYDGGMTNMDAGLSTAQSMLRSSNAKKKIIVLMSDGLPNEGRVDDSLIAFADEIKDDGILIYTLGFFEDLGSDKSTAQHLMEQIASEGCHYEVASADDLVFFFGDIADQINGTRYIYVRIACPVDVSVSYNGETLNSAKSDLSQRTEFGTLTYEKNESASANTDDRIKILRLKEGVDYDIQIVGTGRGIMDYTIGFVDEEGEYSDLREFEDIKITKSTVIDTVAEVSDETVLRVDEDGDGRYDISYRAEKNGYGEEIRTSWLKFVVAGVVFTAILALELAVFSRKRRKRK